MECRISVEESAIRRQHFKALYNIALGCFSLVFKEQEWHHLQNVRKAVFVFKFRKELQCMLKHTAIVTGVSLCLYLCCLH